MIIKSLELTNFKNYQGRRIEFAPGVTNIYGANGSGKTTIMDALYFLLYGKDSTGASDTKMRPYGADGELIHDIDTSVKGVFEDNGNEFILEVVFKEKWTKMSGSDERRLTGNTTEYFIDGVPKKAKEYQSFVQEWFVEPWFSLTSNPAALPSLHWQEQRKLLLDIVGDIADSDVFAANPELEAIAAELGKYGVDDLKAKLLKEKKGYAKDVAELPARIDERRKSLMGLEDAQALKEKAELTLLKAKEPYEQLQAERIAIVSGSRAKTVEASIAAINTKLDAIKAVRRERVEKVKLPFSEESQRISVKCAEAASELRVLRPQLVDMEKQVAAKEEAKAALVDSWDSVDNEVFDESECPCCHRPYTEEMLEPMLEAFNKSKAERLESMDTEGRRLAGELDGMKEAKAKLLARINELSKFETDEAPKLREANAKAMAEAVAKVPPVEEFIHPDTHEKYWELVESLKLRQKEMEEARLDVSIQLQDIDKKIIAAKAPVEQAEEALIRVKIDTETRGIIAQLESEKKNAMLKLGDVEQKLFLLGKFVATKMSMLDEKFSTAFPGIRFKLFEANIGNEGIKETCELTMHGVPYRQLSNAEKCRAGMVVVRTISEKMHLQNPVFIDNRESITDIGEAPGQVINLIVNPDYEEVTVRYEVL